jgi:glutamyl-tRNA synthetase
MVDSPMKPVRVRFAPSPTGRTHLGGARTALYNFLLAQQTGGKFVLRLEDTDRKRYQPDAETELAKSLHWLGLEWDEGFGVGGVYGPYRQTERKDIYQEYAKQLVESGYAYYCFCSPDRLEKLRQEQARTKQSQHYDGTCRNIDPDEASRRVQNGEPHVIRFKMPKDGTITVHDRLRGDIVVENKNLDDYILVKSDGLALYHLAAMVDDHLMKITHVLRSAEWLSTFPLHAHIIRAFGWDEPEWVHLSLFLKPSGKGKMSKRESTQLIKDGHSIYIGDLEELGYLPEAVINWIALMGWSYDDHTEFFSMSDLVEKFDLNRLNPSPAAINFTKLDHFNGLHIRSLEIDDLSRRLVPIFKAYGYNVEEKKVRAITPLIQERLVTLDEAPQKAGFFFQDEVKPMPEQLIGKNMTVGESLSAARSAYEVLSQLPKIDLQIAEEPMRKLADDLGLKAGQLFGILRIAVTGQEVSPPLFESMEIIGKDQVMQRISNAINILENSKQ